MALPGKHVLIIVENLPVPFDRRVWMEATTLRSAGYEVSVISPTGKGSEAFYEEIDGIHVYRHHLPPDISSVRGYLHEYAVALSAEWKLARRVHQRRRVDAVHICNPPDLLFLVAVWMKVFCGARVLYDQHDLNPEMYEAKYGRRGVFYYALRAAERLTFRTADVVIATNDSHKEIAITRGHTNTQDVFIVRSGPDLRRFSPVREESTYRRGRKYLVGYVGVMGEPEGIDILLRAVDHIVHGMQRNDIGFVLIGSGPQLDAMKQMRDSLHLGDYVEFTGRIPDAEMIAHLSTADVCVAPDVKSSYNDRCTMNKVLEYMALGKPVLQFDLVEGRRSAQDAAAYATGNDPIDLANKLVGLLEDPKRREEMGRIGRRRMEAELEWSHQVPKLLSAYTRLFGE